TELWVPSPIRPQDRQARGAHTRTIIARLKSDVDLRSAQSEVVLVGSQMARANPQSYPQDGAFGLQVISLHELTIGKPRTSLVLVLAAAGCLLLIAAVNVASLVVARSSARSTELAVRTALGARFSRIRRQLITEGFWLSCLGSITGLALASICLTNLDLL